MLFCVLGKVSREIGWPAPSIPRFRAKLVTPTVIRATLKESLIRSPLKTINDTLFLKKAYKFNENAHFSKCAYIFRVKGIQGIHFNALATLLQANYPKFVIPFLTSYVYLLNFLSWSKVAIPDSFILYVSPYGS